jgi:hypothetical protein
VSVRLSSNALDAVVVLTQIDGAIESTNKDRNIFFRIVRNATLTNAGFLAHAEGVVDYDINATALTGGTEVVSGYFTSGRAVSLGGAQTFRNQIGRFINGTSEVYTLTFKPDTNLSAAGQIGWYTLVG